MDAINRVLPIGIWTNPSSAGADTTEPLRNASMVAFPVDKSVTGVANEHSATVRATGLDQGLVAFVL